MALNARHCATADGRAHGDQDAQATMIPPREGGGGGHRRSKKLRRRKSRSVDQSDTSTLARVSTDWMSRRRRTWVRVALEERSSCQPSTRSQQPLTKQPRTANRLQPSSWDFSSSSSVRTHHSCRTIGRCGDLHEQEFIPVKRLYGSPVRVNPAQRSLTLRSQPKRGTEGRATGPEVRGKCCGFQI